MNHGHTPDEFVMETGAFYRKDNWPGDSALNVDGIVYRCRCGQHFIQPNDVRLARVEVDVVSGGTGK